MRVKAQEERAKMLAEMFTTAEIKEEQAKRRDRQQEFVFKKNVERTPEGCMHQYHFV